MEKIQPYIFLNQVSLSEWIKMNLIALLTYCKNTLFVPTASSCPHLPCLVIPNDNDCHPADIQQSRYPASVAPGDLLLIDLRCKLWSDWLSALNLFFYRMCLKLRGNRK